MIFKYHTRKLIFPDDERSEKEKEEEREEEEEEYPYKNRFEFHRRFISNRVYDLRSFPRTVPQL